MKLLFTNILKKKIASLAIINLQRILKLSLLILTCTFFSFKSFANYGDDDGIESSVSKRLTGSVAVPNSNPILPGTFPLVDGATSDLTYSSNFEQSKRIKNVISLKIHEETNFLISSNFTASVTIKIEYGPDANNLQETTQTLEVTYNKDPNQKYNAVKYFSFDDAQYVKITIMGAPNAPVVNGLDTRMVLFLDNEMQIKRYYNLTTNTSILQPQTLTQPSSSISAVGLDTYPLNWSWNPSIGNTHTQIEWAWVENEMESNYYNPGTTTVNTDLLFSNGATRIDLPLEKNNYAIPLFYDGIGKLYYRIRAVNIKKAGIRQDGPWSTVYAQPYTEGHNDKLNWQVSTSYAEEGKRKTVMQYFDGSLRNRQTVTKDNSTNTVVVAESMYDGQGRPVVQILPTPTMGTVIQYQSRLNMFNGQTANQDPATLLDFEPMGNPLTLMNTTFPGNPTTASGASKYYSPNNDLLTGAGASAIAKNIPDAEGLPFTMTRYLPDATGRVQSQSGVGAAMALGSGHETKYYYGGAAQEELDGLFGTEVGNFTHYFKNMVKDANGQMSVSYTDMHGRTIATALAGESPDNLKPLVLNTANYPNQANNTLKRNLLDGGTNLVKTNGTIESTTTILVPFPTVYTFEYKLTPEILQQVSCTPGTTICYDCMYDLEIAITDDNEDDNLLPKLYKFSNVRANINTSCTNPPFQKVGATLTDPDVTISALDNKITIVPHTLGIGSYTIRKTLTISKSSVDRYRSIFMANALCKSQQQIIDSVYNALLISTNCANGGNGEITCESCLAGLGTLETYTNNFLLTAGYTVPFPSPLPNGLEASITKSYNDEKRDCKRICEDESHDLSSIKNFMLLDMQPYTGQYAINIDGSVPILDQIQNIDINSTMTKKYNIFSPLNPIGSPYFRRPLREINPGSFNLDFYYDDYGILDPTIHPDGTRAMLENTAITTPQSYQQLFSPSWAEALLPYHPEYQKLKFTEANLIPTYDWIAKSQRIAIATNAAPISGATNPQGYIVTNANINSGIDPFYNIPGAASYKSQMQTWLNGNYKDISGTGSIISMWQMAYGNVMYSTIADPFVRLSSYLIPQNPDPSNFYPSLSLENRNAIWKAFNSIYASERAKHVNLYIEANRPLTDAQQLIAQKYKLHFASMEQVGAQNNNLGNWDWVPVTPGGPPANGGGTATPATQYASNCNSYINSWKQALLKCDVLAAHPQKDAILTAITTRMKQVCINGSNQANPRGASNVAPTTALSVTDRSFEDIINNVFATYSIPRSTLCNPFIIEFPKPYGKGPKYDDSYTASISDCMCEQFTKMKNEAVAASGGIFTAANITFAQFNAYVDAAYGETITLVLFNEMKANCGRPYLTNCRNVYDTVYRYCDIVGNPCFLTKTTEKDVLINTNVDSTTHSDSISKDILACGPPTYLFTTQITAISARAIFADFTYGNTFVIQYKLASSSNWGAGIQVTDTYYDFIGAINGLTPNTTYEWRARLLQCPSFYCPPQTFTTLQEPSCGVPFNLQVTPLDNYTNVRLSWNFNYAQNANLQYAPLGSNSWVTLTSSSFVAIYSPTLTSFQLYLNNDILLPLTTYKWRVQSVCLSGVTGYVNGPNFTTGPLHPICPFYCPRTVCDTLSVYPLSTPQPLPTFLMCGFTGNKKCQSCTDISLLTKEYKETQFGTTGAPYPAPHITATNLNALQIADNMSYARFLNYRLGYQYNWLTYTQALINAIPSCNIANYNTNTNTPQKVICANDMLSIPHVNVEEPCVKVYNMAIIIGQSIYLQQQQFWLEQFEAQYVAKCLAAKDIEQFHVTYTPKEYHYTLYYYDQAGNLVKTVPPKGVLPDFSTTHLNDVKAARIAETDLQRPHTFTTNYRYNSLNQVAQQNTPDAGLSEFWYDALGRLVVSQNAKQTIDKKYSYTLYDPIGRIREVGQKPQVPNSMSQMVSQDETALIDWLNNATDKEQITNTFYDQPYFAFATSAPILTQQNMRNRVSFTSTKNLETDYSIYTATYYSYDVHGNVDELVQDYNGLASMVDASQRFKKMTYNFDLISGKVNEVCYQPGQEDAFYHRYKYDAENRITETQTSRDRIIWERDAAYNYYKHGPLARTELGQLRVQGMDYAYTLQGWLKGVNSTGIAPLQTGTGYDMGGDGFTAPPSTAINPVARDVLGYALHYYHQVGRGQSGFRDYSPIATGSVDLIAAPISIQNGFTSLFNGNIAGMTVNNAGLQKLNTTNNHTEAFFNNYSYDQLNRIVEMKVFNGFNQTTNSWDNAIPLANNQYGENISYDPNGNIMTYKRNASSLTPSGSNSGGVAMDDLDYKYELNKNQLRQVTDAVSTTNAYTEDIDDQANTDNYEYDAIGNLTKDIAEHITSIEWTVYGKIKAIYKDVNGGTTINYSYDASGNRISKAVTTNAGTISTIYVRDATGNVMSVYEESTVTSTPLKLKETHLYGSSRLGLVTAPTVATSTTNIPGGVLATISTFTRGEKNFELTNHLGNVLVTISDKKILITPTGTGGGGCVPGTAESILNIYTRDPLRPIYVASQEINFWPNFESIQNDEFLAYIDPTLTACVPPITNSNIPQGSYYTADIITANDYYPGGMNMPGRKFSGGSGYRYGFNGKENDKDAGEGIQDYGMRIYDSRLVRFLSVDPIAKKYPELTPYQFASNTPIQAIDLDGKEAWICVWGSQSKDVDGDGKPEIGHTAIIVANYKQVGTQIVTIELPFPKFVNGFSNSPNSISFSVPIYEATGSYTYYDFWPTSANLAGKEAISDVAGVANKNAFTMQSSDGVMLKDQKALENYMISHDMTQISDLMQGNPQLNGPGIGGAEGRSPDGIIKLNLTPGESFSLNSSLEIAQATTTIYNGLSNNCTTFVCNALTSVGVEISPEKIEYWPGFFANGKTVNYSNTPNKTYQQLSSKPNITVVKNGTQATSESYKDAILDSR